ncbi:MAG: Ig-like domain-containing protein [Eubacterium sp.]|nr:Ig-like domain-containing protein [Eubacterium sp.]
MKQKFMKKALAVALSTAMVFSASSVSGMQSASAAAKFVGLNTTFKTLKVGQKDYKLKLVNNTQNWKINKVSTSNKQIATVYGKKASYVLLKGKSEGRATIKVSLKTSARKKNNTKVLRCRVKVVAAGTTTPTPTPNPTPTPTPSQTSKVVATQAELTSALADSSLKSITVKTDSTTSFTIPAGSHTAVDLTVDAPNAEVTNSGVFKSITIAAIKDSSWTENATGNTFKVDALKARIVVGTGASVAGVSITKANADVVIVVNGKLTSVTISAKAKLALSGAATESTAVKIQAAGSELTAEIPVAVEASADATIDLKAKAEKSTVKVTNTAATVTVKNNTTATVEITKPDNTVQKVSPKGSATIKPSTSGTNGGYVGGGTSGGSWGGGSSSGGSYIPSSKTVCTQEELNSALKNTSLKKILIEDREKDNGTEITIPEGDYNVDLVVNAPKKTITNSGSFKSIEIQDIKPATWIEKSKKANSFRVTAPNPRIVVDLGAVIKDIFFGSGIKNVTLEVKGEIGSINCGAKDANLALDVQDAAAAVGTVSVNESMSVTINAEAEVAKDVKIKVELKAENATLTSAVPVDVTSTVDDTVIVLEETAAGSTITVTEDVKTVGVSTDTAVEVKKESGESVVELEPGDRVEVDVTTGETTEVKPTGITLNVSEMAIDLATEMVTGELTLSPDPANASDNFTNITWESSDETVATVAGTGTTATVTGVNNGTATITATATYGEETFTATCTVTVTGKSATTEGLTQISISGGTVEVTTKAGLSANTVSPDALTITGITASAKEDENAEETSFTVSRIDLAEGEDGITKVSDSRFTVATYSDSKKTYQITVTATGGTDNKYTIKAPAIITINSNASADGFDATIDWGTAEQVTNS